MKLYTQIKSLLELAKIATKVSNEVFFSCNKERIAIYSLEKSSTILQRVLITNSDRFRIEGDESYDFILDLSRAMKVWKVLSGRERDVCLEFDGTVCKFTTGSKESVERVMEVEGKKDYEGIIERTKPSETVLMGMETFAEMTSCINLINSKKDEGMGFHLIHTEEGMRMLVEATFQTIKAVYECSGKLTNAGYFTTNYFAFIATDFFNSVKFGWEKDSPFWLYSELEGVEYNFILAPRVKINE